MNVLSLSSVIASLLLAISSHADTKIVGYIDFPTCSHAGSDANCLAALGVPGYADHPYNVLIFAFYVSDQDKLYDAVERWANPTTYFSLSFREQVAGKANPSDDEFRAAVKSLYKAAGIKLLLSVFGATDHPIAAGLDPQALGLKIAGLVTKYDFDGVDVDFEGTQYFNTGDGTGENWLITLTKVLRAELGDDMIITHAPQAPYFMGLPNYRYGAYLKVHEEVGDLIDWYNVQFYNQGSTTYNTYQTLFETSNGWSSNTAVNQILSGSNSFGIAVPESKVVIGKFVRDQVDGFTGWISAENMKAMFLKAGWTNGFMLWQVPGDAVSNYAYSKKIAEAFGDLPTPSPVTPAPVTSAPTTASPITSAPTTTAAPTTPTPTVRPTTSKPTTTAQPTESSPPTTTAKPTTAKPTTPSPTVASGGGADSIKLTNNGALSQWWFAANFDGQNEGISKFELLYSGNSWLQCSDGGWAWTCHPSQPLTLPLTVRLTSISGKVIVADQVVTSFANKGEFDFGANF